MEGQCYEWVALQAASLCNPCVCECSIALFTCSGGTDSSILVLPRTGPHSHCTEALQLLVWLRLLLQLLLFSLALPNVDLFLNDIHFHFSPFAAIGTPLSNFVLPLCIASLPISSNRNNCSTRPATAPFEFPTFYCM